MVAISKNKFTWILQSTLYLYHLWVFYIGSIFVYFYIKDKKKYRKFVTVIIFLIIGEGCIVILQNLGFIPFLWNERYRIGYNGFLSGTLGPNKIVLGMTMLISIAFLIGVFYQKAIKINKALLLSAIGVCAICILLSGSRTTYVGLAVFLAYFFLTQTGKFINFGIIASILAGVLLLTYPGIIERIEGVVSGRVTEQITSPEELTNLDGLSGVYVDLSAGRNQLHARYAKYLLSNPYVIPFGIGFNNRLTVGSSAHNMYLNLIKEVGIIGLILFFRWLLSFLLINKKRLANLRMALNGLVLAMLVTLYFGEHLYVYRPLFGILGYFMVICILFLVPFRKLE